ncbi:E3 ubiquitin-protein ligase RNF4 [Temnothorax longispinosus]|uniref:E3 ubiquitin-protein ligase RNF4 n=1 Tax=Temnothorax longispinosus TaxID=300112 RepID=UPI003A99EF2F
MIRIRVNVYEDITDDSIMNDSVVDISPTLIDVIDLTKESPSGSARTSRSRQRNTGDVASSVTNSSACRCRRPLSPIVLGNTPDAQTKNPRKKRRMLRATSSNEVLTVDDTNKEDDKPYCIVESDDRQPIPLTCPICLESLTSNLKPTTTRCGHLFCIECLESFIRISKKCPTCKTAITLKSCTRLYI